MISHPFCPRRTFRPDFRADPPAPPPLVFRQVGQILAVAFPRMDDREPFDAPDGVQQPADRSDRPPRQRNIVAHQVHITADAAEIRLHVDHHERGVFRLQIAVERVPVGSRVDVHPDLLLNMCKFILHTFILNPL